MPERTSELTPEHVRAMCGCAYLYAKETDHLPVHRLKMEEDLRLLALGAGEAAEVLREQLLKLV